MSRKLTTDDWLHSRGWDFVGEYPTLSGGVVKLYKSRRTGQTTIIEIDGSNVLVEYESGTCRWKMTINLK